MSYFYFYLHINNWNGRSVLSLMTFGDGDRGSMFLKIGATIDWWPTIHLVTATWVGNWSVKAWHVCWSHAPTSRTSQKLAGWRTWSRGVSRCQGQDQDQQNQSSHLLPSPDGRPSQLLISQFIIPTLRSRISKWQVPGGENSNSPESDVTIRFNL